MGAFLTATARSTKFGERSFRGAAKHGRSPTIAGDEVAGSRIIADASV